MRKKVVLSILTSITLLSCNPPNTHQHVFDKKVVSEQYFKESGTCQHKPKYYYSCECGAKSNQTFEHGEFAPHHVLDHKCKDCNKEFTNIEDYHLNEIYTSKLDDYNHPAKYTLENNDPIYKELDILKDLNNMPFIDIYGEVETATKEKEVDVTFNYHSKDTAKDIKDKPATIKWQGATSTNYPKKNYTLKLKKKVEIVSSWGEQKKYCLKANYVDYSQSRNVVSAKIYKDIAESRGISDDYSNTPNYGVVDGFPVLVYFNNCYQGLYTFNIPKDKWMFSMINSDAKQKAIIFGDSWTKSVAMQEEMPLDFSKGWEEEFIENEESTEDPSKDWVPDSFNAMYNFIHNSEEMVIKSGLSTYINIPRCIDTMLYTYVIGAEDNVSKNILWTTYNGTQWTCTPYDMDDSWGLYWNGKKYFSPSSLLLDKKPETNSEGKLVNFLWGVLYDNYYDDIVNRYKTLRNTILKQDYIENKFNEFFNLIPDIIYKTESAKWPGVPSQQTNNKTQIFDWAQNHLSLMDEALK